MCASAFLVLLKPFFVLFLIRVILDKCDSTIFLGFYGCVPSAIDAVAVAVERIHPKVAILCSGCLCGMTWAFATSAPTFSKCFNPSPTKSLATRVVNEKIGGRIDADQ